MWRQKVVKVPRTENETNATYNENLLRLARRCDDFYEDGATFEAASIATIVRVLVHDTNQSESLLTILETKSSTRFLGSQSTDNLYVAGIINGFYGLHARTRMPYRAYRESDLYEFDEWWDGQDFSVAGHKFTRKELILAFANQEGGTHVDRKTDERLQKIRHTPSPWKGIDGDENFQLRGAEHGSICAIGEELLFSLTPEPKNRLRMLSPNDQLPYYLSQEESDHAKIHIARDIEEIEGIDLSKLSHAQCLRVDIALHALQFNLNIDHLNGEQARVWQSIRRDLSSAKVQLSELPDET